MCGVLLGAAYVASSRMHFPWHSLASPRPALRLGLGLWLGQATFIGHFTWQPHMNFHRNCKQNFYTHANSPAALCKNNNKKRRRKRNKSRRLTWSRLCVYLSGASGGCMGVLGAWPTIELWAGPGAFPAVVYHVDLQLKCCQCPRITPCYGTQVDRVQFICGYNLIFNIHNSRCRCHLPALATCPARQQLKHCQMLLKCQKIRIHE